MVFSSSFSVDCTLTAVYYTVIVMAGRQLILRGILLWRKLSWLLL